VRRGPKIAPKFFGGGPISRRPSWSTPPLRAPKVGACSSGISSLRLFFFFGSPYGWKHPGADVIPALSRNRPIMSGKIMQGQMVVDALETVCSTADPCLGGVRTKDYRHLPPCSMAQMATNTTEGLTFRSISRTLGALPDPPRLLLAAAAINPATCVPCVVPAASGTGSPVQTQVVVACRSG
jgi:hypothetical protein